MFRLFKNDAFICYRHSTTMAIYLRFNRNAIDSIEKSFQVFVRLRLIKHSKIVCDRSHTIMMREIECIIKSYRFTCNMITNLYSRILGPLQQVLTTIKLPKVQSKRTTNSTTDNRQPTHLKWTKQRQTNKCIS